jgi:hypothetical protein
MALVVGRGWNVEDGCKLMCKCRLKKKLSSHIIASFKSRGL